MRIAVRGLIVGIVALSTASGIAEEPTHASSAGRSTCGRYQLFQGTYSYGAEVDGKFATADQTGLFKIDTDTGKTWIYVEGKNKDGDLVEKWLPISNN